MPGPEAELRAPDSRRELQRAVALQHHGRLAEAVRIFEQVARAEPRNVDALHLLGVARALAGELTQAEALLGAAIALRPGSATLLYDLAKVYRDQQRLEDSLGTLDRALALAPDHASAHYNRGRVLLALERFAEALASLERALRLRANDPNVHFSRGIALAALQRPHDALASYDRALALRPVFADALNNRGTVLKDLEQYDQALESYERVRALAPLHAGARWNTAMILLLRGALRQGWELYEARFELRQRARQCPQPLWHGAESLCGRTILLHAEQGFGDTLQFCRYLRLVCERAAQVVLEVPAPLKWLMARLGTAARIIGVGEATGAFDYHCPLLSLPRALGTTLDSIPATVPYLSAEPEAVARWRTRLSPLHGLKVGIVWQGNPGPERSWARGRSAPLSHYQPLSELDGVTLVSLQKGSGLEQLDAVPFRSRITAFSDLDSGSDAFRDTAALMMNLDLVIGTDTAAIHLAGALGIPVWLALQRVPDWRWMLERADCPWYPTMRLFRQSTPGDWRGTFARIAATLARQGPAPRSDPALVTQP